MPKFTFDDIKELWENDPMFKLFVSLLNEEMQISFNKALKIIKKDHHKCAVPINDTESAIFCSKIEGNLYLYKKNMITNRDEEYLPSCQDLIKQKFIIISDDLMMDIIDV